MNEELPRIADAGGTLVALSSDSAEKAAEVSSRDGLSYVVIPDTKLEIAKAFGVRQASKHSALPSVFVQDSKGRVVYAYVGVEASDRPDMGILLQALASCE